MATNIDKHLANRGGNLPLFLQRRIHFKEATDQESAHAASFSYNTNKKRPLSSTTGTNSFGPLVDENGFRRSDKELFPSSKIRQLMEWERIVAIGPGLNNLGNTCFLNSVLQCLTYTPPLANFLLQKEHSKRCRVEGFCLVCELERHLDRTLGSKQQQERLRSIQPSGTVSHLKSIAKHMRVGRQEDSHEFLRFMIEAMQRNLLAGMDAKNMDGRLKETTLVHQIFGGYLQSRVHCLTCQHVSSTFDPFLDLSLDVRGAEGLQKALRLFVQPERLSKSNRYRCEHCGKLTDADKSMNIYRNPAILTVHLKRFQMTPYGDTNKINKNVEFPSTLDISPFTQDRSSGCIYDLYAVLVHEGYTCNSGHYHAFVKAPNCVWYSMNDSSVHQVGLASVLGQKAYLLFYTRRNTTEHVSESVTAAAKEAKTERSSLKSSTTDATSNTSGASVELKHPVPVRPGSAPAATATNPFPTPQSSPQTLVAEKQPPQLPPTVAADGTIKAADMKPPVVSSSMWHLTSLPTKDTAPSASTSASASSKNKITQMANRWVISPVTARLAALMSDRKEKKKSQ